MNRKFRIRGLNNQLFFAVLLSLALSVLSYNLIYSFGNELLYQTVYAENFSRHLADVQFDHLQKYITEEQVTESNLDPLDSWFTREKESSLVLYLDNRIIYDTNLMYAGNVQESEATSDTGGYAKAGDTEDSEAYKTAKEYEGAGDTETATENKESENTEDSKAYDAFEYAPVDPASARTLTLSDGTTAMAYFYYYSSAGFYYGLIAVSFVAAFVIFLCCFTYLVHKKLRYIKQLKEELDILALGDLNYHVTVKGDDELSELAIGINYMRESILKRQTAEEQMRNASLGLVTAMSHDLRTPLTSLLAYLEMIQRGKYENEEQLQHFVERSLSKALQIKSMSDKLFEYFFVYSKEWEDIETEPVDADGFLQNFWGEYAFSLESSGFCVNCAFSQLDGKLSVNTELIQRAFDNLYSNILKYADPAMPVELAYKRVGNLVKLSFKNAIQKMQNEKESTNIGLNTCRQILLYHGGTFETANDGTSFCVTLSLPLS